MKERKCEGEEMRRKENVPLLCISQRMSIQLKSLRVAAASGRIPLNESRDVIISSRITRKPSQSA